MQLLVIGHEDAVRGFALVGVSGKIATSANELNQALNQALSEENIGIILLTENVAELARTRVDHLKAHSSIPLIMEIPGPDGPDSNQPSLGEMIRNITGVKI